MRVSGYIHLSKGTMMDINERSAKPRHDPSYYGGAAAGEVQDPAEAKRVDTAVSTEPQPVEQAPEEPVEHDSQSEPTQEVTPEEPRYERTEETVTETPEERTTETVTETPVEPEAPASDSDGGSESTGE